MSTRVRTGAFILGGLVAALLLAMVVSNFASGSPDGLDSTARRGCTVDDAGEITGGACMAQSEKEHEVGGPFADYGISGIDNEFVSTALAGGLGVLLTFIVGAGLFWLARRRSPATGRPRGGSARSGDAVHASAYGDVSDHGGSVGHSDGGSAGSSGS